MDSHLKKVAKEADGLIEYLADKARTDLYERWLYSTDAHEREIIHAQTQAIQEIEAQFSILISEMINT